MNVLLKLSGLIIIGILHVISTGGIAGAEVPSSEQGKLPELKDIGANAASRYLKLATVEDGSGQKDNREDAEYSANCRYATRIGLQVAIESGTENIKKDEIKTLETSITEAIHKDFGCPEAPR